MLSVWFGAAQRGDLAVVGELMPTYAKKTGDNDETALMLAAKSGQVDVCRVLAQHEAGMRNCKGMTALMMAAVSNNAEICDILSPLEWPLTLENGKDALIMAAEHGSTYALTVLSTHSDLIKDVAGNTALDYAAMHDSIACIRTLAETQKLSLAQIDSAIEKAEQLKSEYIINYLVDLRLAIKTKAKDDTDSKIKELERAVASLQQCFTEKAIRDSAHLASNDGAAAHSFPPRVQPLLPSSKMGDTEEAHIVKELIEENKRLHKRLSVSQEKKGSEASQLASEKLVHGESKEIELLYHELDSAVAIMKDYETRIEALTKTLQERDSTILQLKTMQLRIIAADPNAIDANLSDHDSLYVSTKGTKTPETPKKLAFSSAKKAFYSIGKDMRPRSRPKSAKKFGNLSDYSQNTISFESDSTDRTASQQFSSSRLGVLIDNLKLTISEHESIQACLQAQAEEITRLTEELRGYHSVNLANETAEMKYAAVQTVMAPSSAQTIAQQTVVDMELVNSLLLNTSIDESDDKKAMNVWNIIFRKTLELSDEARAPIIRNFLLTANKDLMWEQDLPVQSAEVLASQTLTERRKNLPLIKYLPQPYQDYVNDLERYTAKLVVHDDMKSSLRIEQLQVDHEDKYSKDTGDSPDLSPPNVPSRSRVSFLDPEMTYFDAESALAHTVSMPEMPKESPKSCSNSLIANIHLNTPVSNCSRQLSEENLAESLPSMLPAMDGGEYNPLMQAVVQNNFRDIGTNLRYAGECLPDGTTALMLAAKHNCIVAVKYLISTEIKLVRSDGKTALDIALEKGNFKVAGLLFEECLDVMNYSKDGHRVTEMMQAVSDGNLKLIWSLIPLQAGLQDEEGRTALMYAVTEKKMNIVQMLAPYEYGISDAEGRTVHDYLRIFITDKIVASQLETSLLRCSLRANYISDKRKL